MADSILVTGGAGYIGSHVVVELAQAGYAPVVLDSFVTSSPAVLPRLEALAGVPVPCVEADVRDVDALRRAFRDHPIAGVIHCAGLKAVGESEARPLAYYDVNVGGTLALAEVMGEAGVATLRVQLVGDGLRAARRAAGRPRTRRCSRKASTGAPSGSSRTSCATWRTATRTGASRCCATSTRPARIPRAGSARRRPTARTTWCRCCAASPPASCSSLAIYGTDWPTPDGTGVRDYLHVQDLAAGHVAALRHLARASGRDDAEPGPRARPFGARGRRRVRARLRAADHAHAGAAPRRRRRLLLRRPDAGAGRCSAGARRAGWTRSAPTRGAGSSNGGKY